MSITLQFASFYDRQEIFMWSNCLLDLVTDFLLKQPVRSLANIVRRKKPWITAEILDLCDKSRELRKKRFEPEGAAKYKEVNNNIKRCTKKAKENWIGEH